MIRSVAISLRHSRLRVDRDKLRRLVDCLDKSASRFGGGCPPGELSIVLLGDRALARIHAEFMEDPSSTDVITFEGEEDFGQAGEICVSADTAATYAREKGLPFSEELSLYVVHGWLHLAGYDDLKPRLKRRMRAAEGRAMALLRRHRLLGAFRFRT